jgi:hypothetical protein
LLHHCERLENKDAVITKEELTELLEITTQAPSAWNLQHWHFQVFHRMTASLSYSLTDARSFKTSNTDVIMFPPSDKRVIINIVYPT